MLTRGTDGRMPPLRLPTRDRDEARVERERPALQVAVTARRREARALEHREQLGRRVDADRERARVALAARVDERLRRLGDAGDRIEGALLEQQPALAHEPPVLLAEGADEPVAVQDLDHEPAAGAQDAADLGQRARVLLVAEIADRREQVERGVEARVGERQLAVVGPLELRPALAGRPACGLVDQRLGAVDADRAVAGARERQRVAAEAARRVEDVAALRAAGELRRRERLRARLRVALVLAVRTEVVLAEELVPGLGRARGAVLHAARVYGAIAGAIIGPEPGTVSAGIASGAATSRTARAPSSAAIP